MRLRLVIALFAVLVACRTPGRINRYRLDGVVVRFDADTKLASIKHGPITDETGNVWMGAMTMQFPVPAPSDQERLVPGISISATVVSRSSPGQYWLEQVRVVEPKEPPKP
jgi:Cu/Ag efflux protein CusF